MGEFLPCPFCGSDDLDVMEARLTASGDWEASCSCNRCPATMRTIRITKEAAEEQLKECWNARYEPTCHNENREHWGEEYDENDGFHCSECEEWYDWFEPDYCPNCGRRIIKPEDEWEDAGEA